MAGLRVVCGLVALGVGVLSLHASAAQSRADACDAHVIQVGPVNANGCWSKTGTRRWRSTLPVTLDGLRLSGTGTVAANGAAGTIASSRSVRWQIGSVQFEHAQFQWQVKTPLKIAASGTLKGLPFAGSATVAFSGANGGSAKVSAQVNVPEIEGRSVSGSVVLTVNKHGFRLQNVHVHVEHFALDQLLFDKLDFDYANGVWTAEVGVHLPVFELGAPTVDGLVSVKNGKLNGVGITVGGLDVEVGAGFVVTQVGFHLGFNPYVISGMGRAYYGPHLAGHALLQIDGALAFHDDGPDWTADGTVTLPWGLPVSPTMTLEATLKPGHSVHLTGKLDVTVHGFGLKGTLDGYATRSAFDIEGDGTLHLGVDLHGQALLSSLGMSACGRIKLPIPFVPSPKVGFSYSWGGTYHRIYSSCDVSAFRPASLASPDRRPAAAAVDTPITITADDAQAGFAVFSAQGGDFSVKTPDGTLISSAPDRDATDAFAAHDSDGTAYLIIPVSAGVYTVEPAGATLTNIGSAPGLVPLDGLVAGGVTPVGAGERLDYTLPDAATMAGRTVSFYQGESLDVAGATPIVEGVGTSGTASFTPEAAGPETRSVFAVVSSPEGGPVEELPVATFSATEQPLPSGDVFVQNQQFAAKPPNGGGWNILLGKPSFVAEWDVRATRDDGTTTYDVVKPNGLREVQVPIAANGAKHATIVVTPVDEFGRSGLTYTCDTAQLGQCPSA